MSDASIKLKIQLYCGDEIAMGPGKADLLDAIRAHGSISAAGRAMDMSYRRAWLLVDVMNRCWREPLVETSPGSSHGGGARVTPMGEAVLTHYRALQARLSGASDCPDQAALTAAMLGAPRKSQKDG
jgi:molybdate transport system regulatory protein